MKFLGLGLCTSLRGLIWALILIFRRDGNSPQLPLSLHYSLLALLSFLTRKVQSLIEGIEDHHILKFGVYCSPLEYVDFRISVF